MAPRLGRWPGCAGLGGPWSGRPLVWEFPGSCLLLTGMECVGKPLRAGLRPAQAHKGEGRTSDWAAGGSGASTTMKESIQ